MLNKSKAQNKEFEVPQKVAKEYVKEDTKKFKPKPKKK